MTVIPMTDIPFKLIPCEQQLLFELAINSGDFW
jgi:hypothetical protein